MLHASHDTILSTFCEPLLQHLRQKGLDLPDMDAELELALQRPSVNAAKFCAWLDRLEAAAPSPALGVQLGLGIEPRHLGVVGYLALSCSNLGQALSRYRRFQELLQLGLSSKVDALGDAYRLSWTQRTANTPRAQEFSLALFVKFYQTLIGKDVPPLRAGLPFDKPEHAGIYESLLGCPLDFATDKMWLELPAPLMAMRISSSDAHLRRLLEQQALAKLQQAKSVAPVFLNFFESLQEHLMQRMKDGNLNADKVAATMGVPLRSFYRHLSDNGLSFRSVVADLRLRMAKQYLSDSFLSQAEIALLLGYSEQSSFIRAFRAWTGITPGEYREKQK